MINIAQCEATMTRERVVIGALLLVPNYFRLSVQEVASFPSIEPTTDMRS